MNCIQSCAPDPRGLVESPVKHTSFCIQKKAKICRQHRRRRTSGVEKVYKIQFLKLMLHRKISVKGKITPVFGLKHLILRKHLFLRIMQSLDERLPLAGKKIIAGEITTFHELLKFIPKTAIAKALSLNTGRWIVNKFEDPYFFRVGELVELARLMNIAPEYLLKIMVPVILAITDRKFTQKPKERSEDVAKERERAKELKSKGMKIKDIIELMDISRMTLYRYLKENENEQR